MFMMRKRSGGMAGKAAMFLVGSLVGAAAVEAAMYMSDPYMRKNLQRKGRRAMRMAQGAVQKIL